MPDPTPEQIEKARKVARESFRAERDRLREELEVAREALEFALEALGDTDDTNKRLAAVLNGNAALAKLPKGGSENE